MTPKNKNKVTFSAELSAMTRLLFAPLLLCLFAQAKNTYSANGRKVIAYTEPVEGTASDNSHKKCIEYQEGGPRDYTKGCVSAILNTNDELFSCEVSFDDTLCNTCKLCETNAAHPQGPGLIGFEVNCNNKLPEKNIQSDCAPFQDIAIQQYLLRPNHFADTPFDFASKVPVPAPAGTTSGVKRIAYYTLGAVFLFMDI